MDLGIVRIEIAGGFEMSLSEHAVFDGTEAVDAPLIVGYGLSELELDWRLGVEAVDDFFAELLVGGHVFGGENDDARSETVTEGVHDGTGPPLSRLWPRAGRGVHGRGLLGQFSLTRSISLCVGSSGIRPDRFAVLREALGCVFLRRRHDYSDLRFICTIREGSWSVKALILLIELLVNVLRLSGIWRNGAKRACGSAKPIANRPQVYQPAPPATPPSGGSAGGRWRRRR